MDAEGSLEDLKFLVCGVVDVEPPDTTTIGGKREQFASGFPRSEKASKFGSMDGLLELGAEKAIATGLRNGCATVGRTFLTQSVYINFVDAVLIVDLNVVINSAFVVFMKGAGGVRYDLGNELIAQVAEDLWLRALRAETVSLPECARFLRAFCHKFIQLFEINAETSFFRLIFCRKADVIFSLMEGGSVIELYFEITNTAIVESRSAAAPVSTSRSCTLETELQI